jgi:conjugal transfer pilus assembly protein TraB
MEGFSKMFGKTPVLTIDTGQQGMRSATPFQRNLSKDSMEAAGIAGVGNALDQLSRYYMDMAQNMFPVVEIDAGRQVDFIVISGVALKLQGKN